MTTTFLPFAKPSLDENEINEVVDCLKSGWISTGPRVEAFENALKEYFNVANAITLSSATAGLHLALLAMELQPGDEVITTPLTFAATVNTIVLAGGTPKFVDIEPDTLNMDLNQLADAINSKTRVVIPVHFAGLPVDLDRLYELANAKGIEVIEDCAHAMGAYYKDSKIGSLGGVQVFSFHPNKNMTTGEGGAITSQNNKYMAQIEKLRFHGIDRKAFNRDKAEGSPLYDIALPGFKYNMMDLQAAIGLHQLKKLDDFIEKRNHLANRYQTKLQNWNEWHLTKSPNYKHKHAWHLYSPRLRSENARIERNDFIRKMRERGIGVGLHYQAVHLFKYYREQFGFKPDMFPVAEQIGENIVSLPLFPDMTEADQDRVIETMREVFDNV